MDWVTNEPSLDDDVTIIDARTRPALRRLVGAALPLMGHQDEAVNKGLAQLMGDGAAGVVCVPTGGGKTRIGAEIAVHLITSAGFRVLWLAHKIELVDQAVEGLARVGVAAPRDLSLGRFQAGDRKVRRRVDCVVASIATLNARDNLAKLLTWNPRFDLVVIDECHHAVAWTWRGLVTKLRQFSPSARLLGLSATPFRSDSDEDKVLRHLFGNLVLHEVGATELIETSVLARPAFIEVDTQEILDFQGSISTEDLDTDFKEWQLQQIADRQARNRLMVDVYLSQRGTWGPTVFFACTIKHCEQIAAMLSEAGIKRVSAVHGDTSRMPKSKREEAIRDFKAGRLDVLVSAMLLTEGTDLPKVRSVFMARPTRSPILFRQMIGRGLRGPRVGGTPECNILLFRDTFSDQAANALASRLAWLAGLEGVASALRQLELKEIEAALRLAEEEDPALVNERAARRARMEALLRAMVADANLVADDEDRRLEGWWELRPAPDKPPMVLPGFRGYDALRELMSSVSEGIRQGTRVSQERIYSVFDQGMSLFARAVAFIDLAYRLRVSPVWVDIEHAELGRSFEIARDDDFEDFRDAYRAAGRELLQREALQYIRRQVRGVTNWQSADAELWKKHVAGQEGWLRLAKRSEEYFDSKEWREVVKRAQASFFEARPDDE